MNRILICLFIFFGLMATAFPGFGYDDYNMPEGWNVDGECYVESAVSRDSDGNVTKTKEYFYDSDLRLERIEFHYEETPFVEEGDFVRYYYYDNEGRMDYWEEYTSDEVLHYDRHYYYDSNGCLLRVEDNSYESEKIDPVYKYTCDADGNVIEEWFDVDNDGEPDGVTTYSLSNGLPVSAEWSPDGSEAVQKYTYSYDGGKLVKIDSLDADTDEVSSSKTFIYKDEGRLVRIEYQGYTNMDTESFEWACLESESESKPRFFPVSDSGGGCFVKTMLDLGAE